MRRFCLSLERRVTVAYVSASYATPGRCRGSTAGSSRPRGPGGGGSSAGGLGGLALLPQPPSPLASSSVALGPPSRGPLLSSLDETRAGRYASRDGQRRLPMTPGLLGPVWIHATGGRWRGAESAGGRFEPGLPTAVPTASTVPRAHRAPTRSRRGS